MWMTHNNFPQPSADAIEHSQALLALMSDDIKKQGGLSFYDFMHRALYQPGYGYYSSGSIKFGEKGDFMTAPLISPLFAQCISRQCNQVIEKMSVPCIFELGAGTGHLAAGILTALAENFSLPDYYYILEVSADCRAQQQATIKSLAPEYYDLVVWLDKLPLEPINGVILANEVLDAMPIHRFRVGEQLEEMRVILSEDRLAWSMSTEVSDQLSMAIDRLGVDVVLLGFVGDDLDGQILTELLQEKGIANDLVVIPGETTIKKIRVIGQNQQLVRLDYDGKYENDSQNVMIQKYRDM